MRQMGFAIVLRRDDGDPGTCEVMRCGGGGLAVAGRHGQCAAKRALGEAVRHPVLGVACVVVSARRVIQHPHRYLRRCRVALQCDIQQQQQGDETAIGAKREHVPIVATGLLSNHELDQVFEISAAFREGPV